MSHIDSAKFDGAFFVFFSYECISTKVGPNDVQFEAMKSAVVELSDGVDKRLEDIYIWLDCVSIPQRNKAMLAATVKSIYTFASVPDAMVLVCPMSEHAVTGRSASMESMKDRMWCRVEHLSYCCSRGRHSMFIHQGNALEPLPEDWIPSVCCVFEASSTCCSKEHFMSARCDRESVVLPLLALYYDASVRQARGGDSEKDDYAWGLISKYKDRMFPKTFIYRTAGKEEVKPLFDDMIERIDVLARENRLKVTSLRSQSTIGNVWPAPLYSWSFKGSLKHEGWPLDQGRPQDSAFASEAQSCAADRYTAPCRHRPARGQTG
eukprot:CAMPEP_0170272414 /NCGR_PEP_ID=MMETSP0116_2-20130129/36160_1 /TAXON_ID=400756 /ORGANISM="Durinskia baltica, Strain CSIRO CS-38" /LENGTH=320 /DNA_ID=CAMNT_0010523623 /DNA_START=16 /DNA_END=976 /DNA_ORIENTATION=-